jgi:formylglycine-generating enzyme required for sulfatase activity
MSDGDSGCDQFRTWPVCSKPLGNTAQGLCDMSGNVSEWVQDEWHSNYKGAPNDGSGWCTGDCPENASDPNYDVSNRAKRLLRGGYWSGDAFSLRAAGRDHNVPSIQYGFAGGRLAR